MDPRKERIKNGCLKILEGINSMSLVNLDDQQVHSLVMMREIARGVVDDRDRKVTKSDVITALRHSIEKMVCASRDIIQILSRMSFEGLDDQSMHLVMRMKEIANGVIDKQPRVAITRPDLLAEQVGFVDEGMRDSPVVESTKISNGYVPIGGAQSMTNEDEMLDVEHVLRFENGIDEVHESLLPCFQQFLLWPPDDCVTLEWVQDMMVILEQASQKMLPSEFCHIVPAILVDKLADAACSILCKEPNCVEINCQGEDSKVIVVGDVHGQFHDLMFLFKHAGVPSENRIYVFNGNYVDKGAWGIEVLLFLLAWKVLMPHRVYLLRGNHESRYCTARYGFKKEVWAKYGDQGEDVYNKFLACFKELPLASVIANCVYTTHGGLFRSIHAAPSQKPKRNKTHRVDLGSLAELSEVKRSFVDCPYEGPNILLSDVLWSRPSNRDGLRDNTGQKLGLLWGPDCTEAFLKQYNLKLIIRSHEGPDARAGRDDDFGDMLSGYSIDHDGESGRLYTLFSAPDYPQFGKRRYNNKGAYAVLKSPDFASPSFHSFKAAERPMVDPYFDFDANYMESSKLDSSQSASTSTLSAPQRFYSDGMRPEFDFGALGIYNAPGWRVELPDGSGGTQAVEVPRAPLAEGLPLPPNIQEPHKAAYEYLFELVAGLKHMIVTRETENRAPVSALRSRTRKREGKGNS
ncbi:serine/threonine-protein phosphatase 7-like isoform X1 [Glycine soja]|uniref:Serine/threonine-protein phosphatase n=3 Tax=Glycine soja TaxID=3848 RepID=A0A445IEP6_GLYSO|nr:serine/threonine-protein phosphatase 7-like isoform X1 [Glycine soja]KHN30064.1 Serine/threonine-protein phosphatase 7 [Glycine soja]RZB84462.1 Serine/threonine-protein phosphatase 7 isoform A [Glycine soja]